ncbi:hypothetical protein NDU88_002826, partial [Pleurodeles waltl]
CHHTGCLTSIVLRCFHFCDWRKHHITTFQLVSPTVREPMPSHNSTLRLRMVCSADSEHSEGAGRGAHAMAMGSAGATLCPTALACHQPSNGSETVMEKLAESE